MRIRNQVLFVMVGFLALVTTGFTVLLYRVQSQAFDAGINGELRTAALMARELLPPGYHDRITGAGSVSDAEYQQIVDRFNRLCVEADLEYLWSLMVLDGKIVFTSATSPSKDASQRDHAGFLEVHSNPELYTKAFETMQPQYQVNDDRWGRIRTALLPFRDAQGRPYLIGASRNMHEVDAQLRVTMLSAAVGGGSILLLGILACLLLAHSLARPVEAVTQAAVGIAAGNLAQKVQVGGAHELALLGQSLNTMSRAIAEQMQALDESREKLHITLQSIGDAVIATDAQGAVAWMNPVAETLTGWSQAQAQGRALEEVFRIIRADTREPLENPIGVVLREGRTIGLANHTVLQDRAGVARPIADSAAPIRSRDGMIVGAVLVFRDVTEQYEKDRALRESTEHARFLADIVQQSSQPFAVGYPDGRVGIVNQAMCDLTGYTADELHALDWAVQLTPPEWLASERAALADLRRTGEPVRYQKEYVRRDGSRVPVELLTHQVVGPTGDLTFYYAFITDITERKQAEEALRHSNLELQARTEELDTFAHTAAHDLRNPLALIAGFAELLELGDSTLSDTERQQAQHTIALTARKMDTIIEELLLLAGVRQAQVTMTRLDMAQIVAEAKQRLADVIQNCRAEIEAPLVWPAADGYAPWVEEIWVNYLSNAVKYGGSSPHIRLGAAVQANGEVRFWVSDDGLGIAPTVRGELFRPFVRLSQTHTKGYGLGLSIVHRIVERLGGQVGVESVGVSGQGSTFYFTLPASDDGV